MHSFRYDTMNQVQLEVLKEIGNIGSGNATTALAEILNKRIDMRNPKAELMDITMLPELVGGPETLVLGILIRLSGDIEGMILFLLEQSSAHRLANKLLGRTSENEDTFGEMDCSALQEIGNIIAGAYLNSISVLTKLTINTSIPYLANDMAGAILSVPAIEFAKVGEKALLIQSVIGEHETVVNGYFILIPTEQSNEKIFTSLGL